MFDISGLRQNPMHSFVIPAKAGGYAVRQAQLQIDAIADGYDPTIGIMHHGRRGLPAYVFDVIEPERPRVDAAVLKFVRERSFSAADFPIRGDGVCRLSPQVARALVTFTAEASNRV